MSGCLEVVGDKRDSVRIKSRLLDLLVPIISHTSCRTDTRSRENLFRWKKREGRRGRDSGGWGRVENRSFLESTCRIIYLHGLVILDRGLNVIPISLLNWKFEDPFFLFEKEMRGTGFDDLTLGLPLTNSLRGLP